MGDRPGRPQGAASFSFFCLSAVAFCLHAVLHWGPGNRAGSSGGGWQAVQKAHQMLCEGWSLRRRQGLPPDSRQAPAFFCARCLHDLRDLSYRWRPYRVECTGSLPTSEVKRRRARLVLGWGTAREDLRVLPAFVQFWAVIPTHVRSLPVRLQEPGNAHCEYNAAAGILSLAAIPRRMHRISSDLRS